MVVMMFGYGYGSSWPVWEIAVMWIVMLAFVGLLAWGFYVLASGASRRPADKPGEDAGDPGRILDERLARGEINADEYAQLREALASGIPRRAGTRSRA
jgi:putative membrane protein